MSICQSGLNYSNYTTICNLLLLTSNFVMTSVSVSVNQLVESILDQMIEGSFALQAPQLHTYIHPHHLAPRAVVATSFYLHCTVTYT